MKNVEFSAFICTNFRSSWYIWIKEFKENDLDFNLFLFFDERVSIFSLDDSNRI